MKIMFLDHNVRPNIYSKFPRPLNRCINPDSYFQIDNNCKTK